MAKDINVDDLAKWTFWITFAGCVAYVLVVALFILSGEPSQTPQTTTESGHK
ncbi:MAG: hypothetical protein HS104_28655 [Polyangiaceae bacterium]|nr:hypothetical protein [Polyangiaceae bacterium]MBK8995652.1 hypothetical protein [Myxococcales bacterium]MCL4753826.1 hypothetical protein [Myxococcales bacterium]